MTQKQIEAIRELARRDALHSDFPFLRFEMGSREQDIYDQAFAAAWRSAECQ